MKWRREGRKEKKSNKHVFLGHQRKESLKGGRKKISRKVGMTLGRK